jgi:hypothetical protein
MMRTALLSAALLFITMVQITLAGCAGTATTENARQLAGGLALDLLVERTDGSRAFYRVFPDGTLGYGGGADARSRRITWTGTMTEQQVEHLARLVDEHGWHMREPKDGPNPDEVVFRIDLRTAEGRFRYRVRGDSPAILPVYNHLREIALLRFEHVIETLPRPGVEPQRQ